MCLFSVSRQTYGFSTNETVVGSYRTLLFCATLTNTIRVLLEEWASVCAVIVRPPKKGMNGMRYSAPGVDSLIPNFSS